jgi:hypothetical protein
MVRAARSKPDARALIRGLIDRATTHARFKLTPLGRDVLAKLLKPPDQD